MPSRTPAYEEEQRLIEQERLLIEQQNYLENIHETKKQERIELHTQRKILCNELINIYLKAYYRRVEQIVSEDSPFSEQIIQQSPLLEEELRKRRDETFKAIDNPFYQVNTCCPHLICDSEHNLATKWFWIPRFWLPRNCLPQHIPPCKPQLNTRREPVGVPSLYEV